MTIRSAPSTATPGRRHRQRRFAPAPGIAGGLALMVVISACGGSGTGDEAASTAEESASTGGEAAGPGADLPLTVADCDGEVTFDERPERVVTVGTSAVALLDAAGAADRIVGRSGEFGAPLPDGTAPEATGAEVLDPSDPALEVLVGAEPDLVFGYGLFNTDPEALHDAGISTLTVSGECSHDALSDTLADATAFEVVAADIRTLGSLFGTGETAEAAAADLEARVEAATAGIEPTGTTAAGVYFFADALSVNGPHSVVDDQLSAVGLTNVFSDLDASFAEIGIEALIDADPEIIVLTYGANGESAEEAREQLLALPGADDLRAVTGDRVIEMPYALRSPDPGAVAGLELLAEQVATG